MIGLNIEKYWVREFKNDDEKSHYDVIRQCYVIAVFLLLSAYTVKSVPNKSAEATANDKKCKF